MIGIDFAKHYHDYRSTDSAYHENIESKRDNFCEHDCGVFIVAKGCWQLGL
jgi:hypothetical protein